MPKRLFQPGHAKLGGRKEGVKNKKSREVDEFFADVRTSAEWQQSAQSRILRGRAPHLETLMVRDKLGDPTTKVEGTVKVIVEIAGFKLPVGTEA